MTKNSIILILMLCIVNFCYTQVDEMYLESDGKERDSIGAVLLLTREEVSEYLNSLAHDKNDWIIGGYVSSIFHESIDSAKIVIHVDNEPVDTLFSQNGLFSIVKKYNGSILDLSFEHPDFHPFDTSLLVPDSKSMQIQCSLEPKYKILLRGRVFAGNMPLGGVDVEINHEDTQVRLKTRGCFYDDEDYWNCLYNGMFKQDITTDNPDDSVLISLSMKGMKPRNYSLIISEYQGEIMELKMKYASDLPNVPINNLNFKLGFPFFSSDADWFVGLSYYRALNNTNLRRFSYGVDGDIYITTISISHSTFPGLDQSTADSVYLDGFIGPSFLFWFTRPERRFFSSYAGLTAAVNISFPQLTFQPFIGTRLFLDMNKAISFEFRYTEYKTEITHYIFKPYGNADKFLVEDLFIKLNGTLGIQIAF